MLDRDELVRAARELGRAEFCARHRHPYLVEFETESSESFETHVDDEAPRRGAHTITARQRVHLTQPGGLPSELSGRIFKVASKNGADVLIGRSPLSDITIDDDRVSTRHAILKPGPGGLWLLTDLRSTNGTSLNGRTVPYGVPLPFKTGSVLSFGVLSFRFLDAAHVHRIVRRAEPDVSELSEERAKTPADEDLSSFGFVVRCEPLTSVMLPLDGRQLSIGRTEDNDIVLPHSGVSRRHATIARKANRVLLRDLGSRNGVDLGDRRVEGEATFRPGEEVIHVGPFELRVDAVSLDDTGQPLDAPEDESIAGSLETAPLAEILLGIERTGRSGAIRIRSGEESGEIVFSAGAPHRARFGAGAGATAIAKMIALTGGTFVMWPSTESVPGAREIDASFTKLVIDARRGHGGSAPAPPPPPAVEHPDDDRTPMDILADSILMRRGAVQLVRLVRLATALVTARDLDTLLRRTVEGLTRLLRGSWTTIYLYDAKSEALSPRASDRPESASPRSLKEEGIVGQVARTRQLVNAPPPPHSILAAPMLNLRNELIGVVEVVDRREGRFLDEDEDLLRLFAGYAGSVIENALLGDEMLRRERLAAVGSLAGTIVHDVRNVLTIVHGTLDSMAPRDDDREAFEVIRGEIDKIVDLTTEVLEFARGGDVPLRSRPEDLDKVTGDVVRLVQRDFRAGGLELVFEPGGAGMVPLDARRFGRVIVNLAQNARKVLSRGGKLVVRTRRGSVSARVELEDDGPGIPESIRAQIFTPFVSDGREGGTGLGLAIAKSIVEAYRGQIAARPREPHGTVFEIDLPLL